MKDAEILETLVVLQKIDSAILGVDTEKKELQAKVRALKDKIAANTAEFTAKKTRLDDSRKKRALIEMDIKSKEAEIKAKEGQTGAVKTNEAFKALQNEIDSIRKGITKSEDDIIKIMEDEEGVANWVKTQEKSMKEEESKLLAEIKVIETEAGGKDAVIGGFMKSREEAVSKVDKLWYDRYEKIRKSKGLALAPIIVDATGAGSCGGCKFSVRPQSVIELRKNLTIKTCENCARIWYLEKKEEPVK
jgi:predicted  nucleic acid-binding Zn-ribbon protein